ncbi:unnamed protein product [Phaedon cochleariae]|uniref:Uncharacterized protein n=1 Tax=Phaedon cochleariae TaxID=80249 RepID=A0A9N9SEV9_PHACE|nr:unnamed protein product [Phaedon cochleariae]
MTSEPKASSTPKFVNIKKRPAIGQQEESIQSPILNDDYSSDHSYSEDEIHESNSIDVNYENNSHPHSKVDRLNDLTPGRNGARNNKSFLGFDFKSGTAIIILPILICLMVSLYMVDEAPSVDSDITIHKLSHQFPSQMEDFWLNIDVAVSEIKRWHKPKSVILLYQDDGYKTVESIVEKISKYAVCQITNCSSKPVNIDGISLGKKDILADYGRVIAYNKEQLETSGVMIVKNLERVPGRSAQAFHSLCDEHNPVVENALFLFTMKVKSVQENSMSSIENNLRHLWNDLDDDKFYPLFTRISSTVFPVMEEK